MELLYIWVEKYKNIYRQGFNFSTKYYINFNYKELEKNIISGNLEIKSKENTLSKIFFGDKISNITAIIGENGTGKSTLLDLIMKLNENIIAIYSC